MGEQFDASRPIYAQLVERLKARILAGTYPPGGHLDSVRDLAAAAGVQLGEIESISEAGAMSDPRPMMRMSAEAAGAPPVAGGEIATIAAVTISWDIKE